jgi:hypothetical protein
MGLTAGRVGPAYARRLRDAKINDHEPSQRFAFAVLFNYLHRLISRAATGPVRLPAPLSWRMLTRDPAAAVQRAILREYLRTGRLASRLLDLGVALVFWPFRSFALAFRLTRQVGGQVSHIRSRPVQFFHQLYLAWFHGISPSMYYQMGVVRAQGVSPMAWIQTGQAGLLVRVFREDKALLAINDKHLFDAVLERGAVPRLQLIATLSADRIKRPGGLEEIVEKIDSEQELFLKPVRGRGGRGSMVMVRNGKAWDGYRSDLDHSKPDFSLGSLELLTRLAGSGHNPVWLLQRRARNHPAIRAIFGQALVCIRVVSGIQGDEVVCLGSVLCFGAADSIVSQNGLTVAIDLETGRLGRAFQSSESQEFLPRNPDNGVQIEGFLLPDWTALLSTVSAAHRQFPEYPFLGWDMALSETGPAVIEANGNFGTGAMQKPGPDPMIDERFLSVFHYWQAKQGVAV